MLDRHVERQNFERLQTGIIASNIINFSMARKEGSRAVDPLDFVPDYKNRQSREQTLDEQIQILTRIMGSGPGKKPKTIN